MASPPVRVEMWSDVVCPFCWIGKRHLEAAIERLGMQDDVEVVHRAFRLNPELRASQPVRAYLKGRFGDGAEGMIAHVQRMGADAGLAFDYDTAIVAPTLDAHRLVRHARERGLADAMAERLMRAHFSEGVDIADRAALRRLAEEAGLDGDEVDAVLATDAHVEAVERDARELQATGARGVPLFVIDRRFAVSGAQPVELFEEALRRARQGASASAG